MTMTEREELVIKWYEHYIKYVKDINMAGYVTRQYYYDMVAKETGISWEWVKKILLKSVKRKSHKTK